MIAPPKRLKRYEGPTCGNDRGKRGQVRAGGRDFFAG